MDTNPVLRQEEIVQEQNQDSMNTSKSPTMDTYVADADINPVLHPQADAVKHQAAFMFI